MRTSFYTYFSIGYGTLWLVLLAVSVITQSRVDTRNFGLYGFPVLAAIYAFFRRTTDADKLRQPPPPL
jgi:hypothetical protein